MTQTDFDTLKVKLLQVSMEAYDRYSKLLITPVRGILVDAFKSIDANPTLGKPIDQYRIGKGLPQIKVMNYTATLEKGAEKLAKSLPRVKQLWGPYTTIVSRLQTTVNTNNDYENDEEFNTKLAHLMNSSLAIEKIKNMTDLKVARLLLNVDYFTRKNNLLSGAELVLTPTDYEKLLFAISKGKTI